MLQLSQYQGLVPDWHCDGPVPDWHYEGPVPDWHCDGPVPDWHCDGLVPDWHREGPVPDLQYQDSICVPTCLPRLFAMTHSLQEGKQRGDAQS